MKPSDWAVVAMLAAVCVVVGVALAAAAIWSARQSKRRPAPRHKA